MAVGVVIYHEVSGLDNANSHDPKPRSAGIGWPYVAPPPAQPHWIDPDIDTNSLS
jgi:hypothetical protein